MQHQEWAPPPALRDTIKCFWYNCRELGARPSGFEVTPDGYAEIIFYFGGPCHLVTEQGPQLLPSPFLMGLLDQPALFHGHGRLEIIGVRCFPWMLFELMGLPAGPDRVRVVEHPIAGLQAVLTELLSAGRLAEALNQLAQFFGPARARMANDHQLTHAGAALRQAGGTLPVSQVAAAAHATVRTLERKFKQAAGHTVKNVASLMRFEQVRNHLWRHAAPNLAALAHELGYADQAHLSREFKRYSGTTPAAFARQARSTQQTAGRDFVAFVQS